MALFKHLEDDVAIVRMSGVYKQLPLYTWKGYLYVGLNNNSFVLLRADGSTSKPKCTLVHIDTSLELYSGEFGRLGTKSIKGTKKLSSEKVSSLLLTT